MPLLARKKALMGTAGLAVLIILLQANSGRAAFMEQLSLRPVIATPMELLKAEAGEPIFVSERQAIQVVFSRPVIALGSDFGKEDNYGGKVPFSLTCSDIPGKFRWVTTTIARFDPYVDWPTDLECALAWNKGLTTYDGMPLNLTGVPDSRALVTDPLAMDVIDVSSELADNATDGRWSASTGMPDDKLPEVPSDGRIQLQFSYSVHLALVKDALTLKRTAQSASTPFTVMPCISVPPWLGPEAKAEALSLDKNDTCVQVAPSEPLQTDTGYVLELPARSKYHPLAGRLTTSLSAQVFGLRRFRLPFRQDFPPPQSASQAAYDGAGFRRLDVWLPHGLRTGGVPMLAAQLSLCQIQDPWNSRGSACTPVDYSLGQPDNGTVRLAVPGLLPRRKYKVSVSGAPTVVDKFDLPLESSGATFWTTDISPFFHGPALAASVAQMEVSSSLTEKLVVQWPFISMGSDAYVRSAAVWGVKLSNDAQVGKLVGLLAGNNQYVPDVYGQPDTTIDRPKSDILAGQLVTSTLPLGASNQAGVHVVHTCCNEITWPTKRSISADIRVIVKSSLTAVFSLSESSVTAWVTGSGAGGKAVRDATVWVYQVTSDYSGKGPTVKLASKCRTRSDGTCSVKLPKATSSTNKNTYYSTVYYGVARKGDDVAVVPGSSFLGSSSERKYEGALVLDRALVKPGDTLHVTGYVQQRTNSNSLALPTDVKQVTLVVAPGWDGTSRVVYDAPFDATAGSFHVEITVPEDAKMNNCMLSLQINATKKGDSTSDVTNAQFVIADPRPPTAELTLTAPKWVKPKSKVTVAVEAVSYIGADVSGAVMTLVWRTSKAEGLKTLTTDSTGSASVDIDLSDLPPANISEAGDSVSLDLEWIGPTRERITKSASVMISDTSRSVSVEQLFATSTPGIAFGVGASVLDLEAGGAPAGDVPIKVTLMANTSDPTTDTSKPECTANTTCTVTAGITDASACQLKLPCMGHYLLEACTADSGEKACGLTSLGLSASEWGASPLKSHDDFSIDVDRPKYKIGDNVTFSFQNPWPGANLLISWGNVETLQRVYKSKLPTGPVTVAVRLGNECSGGCNANALLAVPRLDPKAPLPPVPTSKLFDPAAPHVQSAMVRLTVVEDRSLSVSLSISSPSATNDQQPVVPPGGSANISVAVTKGGKPVEGAEITVIAVDKAILDLAPYPLRADIAEQLALELAANFVTTDQRNQFVSIAAVRLALETVVRRLGLDPWLSNEFQVQPSTSPLYYSDLFLGRPFGPGAPGGKAPIDMSDEEYLAQYASFISYNPGSGCIGIQCLMYGQSTMSSKAVSSASSRGFSSMCRPVYMNDMVVNKGQGVRAPSMSLAPGRYPVGSSNLGESTVTSDGNHKGAADNAAGDASSGSTTTTALRQSADFVTTPLFVVAKVVAGGKGEAVFKAPPNLGTFVVRAYAALGKSAQYGAGEAELIVRRSLSLTPSVPRFVRVGDAFEGGVIVTTAAEGDAQSGLAPFTATVKLIVVAAGSGPQPLSAASELTQTVTLSGQERQKEVRFRFNATAIGTATLQFSADDGSGATDSLQLELEVQPQQTAVQVATSFALRSNGSEGDGGAPWQEGLDLPNAVPGSGSLDLLAGIGYLPALQSLLADAPEQYRPEYPDATRALIMALTPATLGYYEQKPSATQSENASTGIADLSRLTPQQYDYGLMWSLPGVWGWTPTRADVVLNTWASWVVDGTKVMGAYAGEWSKVTKLSAKWKAAAGKQLVTDAIQSRQASWYPGPYSDFYTIAWVRLALGANWNPASQGAYGQVAEDLSLSRLVTEARKQGLTVKLLTALALRASSVTEKSDPGFVQRVVDEVLGSMRIQGRTAYVATMPGARSAAGFSDQALALLLLLQSSKTDGSAQMVQKLAAYVGQGQELEYYYPLIIRPSAMGVGIAALALTAYDLSSGSTTPNMTLSAAVKEQVLLQASFSPGHTSQVNSSTPWERLPSPPGALTFNASGTGEVSLVASLGFVPKEVIPFPTYRGIWVEAAIQLVDTLADAPTGPALHQVPLGSVVAVTLQITTPDDLGAVTVEALMPGGLEPLDPNVASGAGTTCALGDIDVDWGCWFWWWWWPRCPSQETRPEVVTFRYQHLSAGTSSIQFRAVAASAGTFVLPPMKAYAENQPELMGATAGGAFVVCPGACPDVAPASIAAARSCPGDCNGSNGVCRLDTGECRCRAGFTGADCGTIVS